jgi:DNA invertase Pin-like site-specific DNA recombinase
MDTNKIRIAPYARVSKDKSDQNTENQLEDLREFVKRKSSDGWSVETEYVDRPAAKPRNRRPSGACSKMQR